MRSMKTVCIALVLACALAMPCAAQETEGVIPRLWQKWFGKKDAETPTQAPAAPVAPVAPSAPARAPQAPAVPGDGARTVVPGLAEMSKEELVMEISDTVMAEPEVMDYIPELKAAPDAEGVMLITYEQAGEVKGLDDLDVETLRHLWGRLNQTTTKINVDRITQQLETIRQTQALQRMTRPPAPANPVPATVTRPPTIERPPQVPTRPPEIPRPARVPQRPPQPPRR